MSVWDAIQNVINDKNNYLRYKTSGITKKWSYEDFLYYRMQNLTTKQRKEIMSVSELEAVEYYFNANEGRDIFNDKNLFYHHFREFMKRDILRLQTATYDDVQSFLDKHDSVILKPAKLYAGLGIERIAGKDKNNILARYPELQQQNYLLEEYVTQASEYQKVYDGCLNTVRITTFLLKSGQVKVIAAANQFGSNGSVVDNDDENGIWANIDVETGIVDAVEINPITHYVNDYHPNTKVRIMGFVNPAFEQMKQLACKTAGIVPQCRLIGWDIGLTKDCKLELIEGNVTPELDLFQAMTGNGFRSFFEKVMVEEK